MSFRKKVTSGYQLRHFQISSKCHQAQTILTLLRHALASLTAPAGPSQSLSGLDIMAKTTVHFVCSQSITNDRMRSCSMAALAAEPGTYIAISHHCESTETEDKQSLQSCTPKPPRPSIYLLYGLETHY